MVGFPNAQTASTKSNAITKIHKLCKNVEIPK